MRMLKKLFILILFIFSTLANGLSQNDINNVKNTTVTPENIMEAILYKKETEKNKNVKPKEGEEWFNVIYGDAPIIISAPHGTRPFRNGEYRFSDGGGTTALAIMLAKLTDATVIYTTKASPSDPNYYDDNDYKDKLFELIKMKNPKILIDIHGSKSQRPYDVDIGTMKGKSLLGKNYLVDNLITSLRNQGILNVSDNYYTASKNETVTKFTAFQGVPAIQLEINKIWLVPDKGDYESQDFSHLLESLINFVNNIKHEE